MLKICVMLSSVGTENNVQLLFRRSDLNEKQIEGGGLLCTSDVESCSKISSIWPLTVSSKGLSTNAGRNLESNTENYH